MQVRRHILVYIGILFFSGIQYPAFAQLGFNLDIKKPKPYENRVLQSEKTGQKKFKIQRHIFQNTATHYNYVFNAYNKIAEVLDRAKQAHTDDYSTLLSFYNYTLDATSQDKAQLDSVIYKTQTGIVLHDLRNDWIDDLYLLWGAAYYFQQKWDSAYQMFQFINYAFADKEKDGYYKYIGSAMDGNSASSIATKEKKNFFKSFIADPPSRNNAFIWQIQTLTQADRFNEAGNLIQTLKNDPNFPKRLQSSLEEAQAYWFYKQEYWDSAATHLINALDNANNQLERARWEYLAAQLFEKSGKLQQANDLYTRSISHTTDPVMEIYGRLNLIRINKEGGDNYIDKNIAELLKMAKRDKYQDYRDVIYFMAAQMEMARNNPLAAQEYILKGARYNNNNPVSRNQTYLKLADMLYVQKKYKPASFFYDSIQTTNLLAAEIDRVNFRREVLTKLVGNMNVIERQDSLQRIAAMPQNERNDYIKKLVRKLRREQGLKEEATAAKQNNANNTNNNAIFNNTNSGASTSDLFRSQTKGEWYFYNTSLKTKGATTFKQVWGNRPNIDNWRRASDVTTVLRGNNPNNTRGNPGGNASDVTTVPTQNSLLNNLPLTPELLKASNDSIQNALYALGHNYADELEDYPSAIETYEELRRRFPRFAEMSNVLFQLQYAYNKVGNSAKAAELKKLLVEKDPEGRYASIIKKGIDPASKKPSNEVTKTYEHVYDLFIEGKFEEAEAAKKIADSLYHTNYWSPQLLYIEAVYHAKQRDDSTAIQILNLLVNQNADSALIVKANTLIDVLSRRNQIEEELRNLQIEQPAEDSSAIVAAPSTKTINPPVEQEDAPDETDTTAAEPPSVEPEPEPVIPSSVKRDSTAINTKDIAIKKPVNNLATDTATKKIAPPPPKVLSKTFTYNTEVPHLAVIVLNKVDIVFGNEAKNAFNRYNKEKFNNQQLDIQLLDIDPENKLLLIGNFANTQAAIDYVQQAKQLAPIQIVPWLKGDKYSFSVISNQNLEVLKNKPDLNAYKKFLEQNLPVKL